LRFNKFFRNVLSISGGQLFSLLLNFISITLFARYIGVEGFGEFNYLLAIVVIISKVVDFGFVPTLFREISIKDEEKKLLASAFYFRIFAAILVLLIANLGGYFLINITPRQLLLFNILYFNIIFSTKFLNIRELLDLPFKVDLNMPLPMIVSVLDNAFLLTGVIILISTNGNLIQFIIIYVVSNIPGFLIIFYLVRKKYKIDLSFSFYKLGWLLKKSFPIYIYIILDILFQQLEVLYLKIYGSDYDVGIYSAGLRIVMPLLIFPAAIIHTIFPTLSKSTDKIYNKFIINFITKILFVFGFMIAVIFLYKGDFVVLSIFGLKYLDSVLPTSILLWGQIFVYISFFMINFLVALNEQKLLLKYSFLVLFINLILAYLLVPSYSFLGASIAKLVTVFFGVIIINRILNMRGYKISYLSKNTILWTAISFILFYLMSSMPDLIYIILVITIGLILLWVLNVFDDREKNILKTAFIK
jgi:O-antigen/teichoic acid export membrane protein